MAKALSDVRVSSKDQMKLSQDKLTPLDQVFGFQIEDEVDNCSWIFHHPHLIKGSIEGVPFIYSLVSRILDVVLDSYNMISETFIGALDC